MYTSSVGASSPTVVSKLGSSSLFSPVELSSRASFLPFADVSANICGMAQLTAPATAETASADFTLVDGQTAAINLFVATGESLVGCRASIQVKASNAEYFTVGEVNANTPFVLVSGPGTFRTVKRASSVACGVDKS